MTMRLSAARHTCAVAAALCGLAWTAPANANLVSWKDGKMVMFDHLPQMQDTGAYYTFRHDFAAGGRWLRLTEAGGGYDQIGLAQANWLAERWNLPGAQGNLYVTGGIGTARSSERRSGPAGTLGVEADYETRRIYTSVRAETFRLPGAVRTSLTARAGIAPYVAGYDALHTWLILQTDYLAGIDRNISVRPTLRLFWNNILVEASLSTKGEPGGKLMIHF